MNLIRVTAETLGELDELLAYCNARQPTTGMPYTPETRVVSVFAAEGRFHLIIDVAWFLVTATAFLADFNVWKGAQK